MNNNIWDEKDWLFLSEDQSSIVEAKLIKQEGKESFFYVTVQFEHGETITICPAIPEIDLGKLRINDIVQNPEKMEVTVKRMESGNRCVISYNANYEEWKKWNESSGFKIDYTVSGILCVIRAEGLADQNDLQKLTEFINLRSKQASRLILDFSLIPEIQKKHCIYLNQMLESLVKRKREIAVVNIDHLCEGIPRNPALKLIRFFDSVEDAQNYYYQNPVYAIVIEDDEVTAKRIERFLEARHFQVRIVHTAEESFPLFGEILPSIILMDIHLPGMNGVDAAKKIRTSSYAKETPLFMLTNERSKEFVLMCKETKVDGYLIKPLTEEGFQTKLMPAVMQYHSK